MRDYFLHLFRFQNWANQLVMDSLIDQQLHDENCTLWMSHIWHAQVNWYHRIRKQQRDQPVWQSVATDPLSALFRANGQDWLTYIQLLAGDQFAQPIAYKNLSGQPMLNIVQDILVHVVNHGTYHRGQVVRRIRELGYTPPSTDFIIYARLYPSDSASA